MIFVGCAGGDVTSMFRRRAGGAFVYVRRISGMARRKPVKRNLWPCSLNAAPQQPRRHAC